MSSESSNVPYTTQHSIAPTPVNTPLNPAPIAQGLSRPTVADIPEVGRSDEEDDDEDAVAALGDLDDPSKQAISAIMQQKLAGLIGRSSGYVENLPLPIKRRVEGLKGLGAQNEELLKKHKKEMYELEKKYLTEVTPLRKRRADVINGLVEPTPEEVSAGEAVTLKDDPDAPRLSDEAADPNAEKAEAGIPEFWLTALKNHIAFSELITDRDEAALRHLKDITLEYLDGEKAGFKILFHFSSNEYFEDPILTKEYLYQDDLDVEGDYLYERAVGCEIKWKEDKNLTQEIEVKRQRNKATNRTRVVRRSKPADSFFNFFTPPEPVDEDDIDEIDDFDTVQENLEMDYQLGQDLKDRVIPRAVDYFTGKALEWEDDDDEEGYSDFEDDDDEDEDEIDSDDEPPVRRKIASKKGKGAENVDPQDCKQQ